jgi:hypothetical protein
MKLNLILPAALLLAVTNSTCAEYLFTWHQNAPFPPPIFHASFVVTDAEMLPGATFSSDTFRNSITFDSLSGVTYHGNDPVWDSVEGTFSPFYLNFTLHQPVSGTWLDLVTAPPPGTMAVIDEFSNTGRLYHEAGYWTYTQIPEPSWLGLMCLGGVGYLIQGRKRAPVSPGTSFRKS